MGGCDARTAQRRADQHTSWHEIKCLLVSSTYLTHHIVSVTNANLNARESSAEIMYARDQQARASKPRCDRIEPRDATIPAVSVHLRRAAHGPIVAFENGYPGSGGDPNTSRRRAIFATIV
ncbi:hypothetical protein HZ326_0449 [Fusarium oxysporum f. sp. albedinis]|nr:hypothetical protein HZ326_0449 [Fusarium oxysporum f. sp. albedinis]